MKDMTRIANMLFHATLAWANEAVLTRADWAREYAPIAAEQIWDGEASRFVAIGAEIEELQQSPALDDAVRGKELAQKHQDSLRKELDEARNLHRHALVRCAALVAERDRLRDACQRVVARYQDRHICNVDQWVLAFLQNVLAP